MKIVSFIILTFAILLGVSFAILNAESVVVHYYIGKKAIPLSILILGVLIIGVGIGFCASIPSILRLKLENRRLLRRIGES